MTFTEAYQRYYPTVLKNCRKFFKNEHTARDATQETLYKLMIHWDELDEKEALDAWLKKVACNKMQYPGQRVQIDVKFVPEACMVGDAKGQKFYQYTAIDEYSRFRYLEAFDEHGTYTLTVFLEHMLKKFPFKVECVQTDNRLEFTKRLANTQSPMPTMFERKIAELGIRHKYIKPYTPRHNGKVERSHRKDNEEFYATHTFYSFGDFVKQLKVRNYTYNKFPIRPLNWKSPADYIRAFLETGEIF